MLRELTSLRLPPDTAYEPLRLNAVISTQLGVDINCIKQVDILRRSIDARQRRVMVNLAVRVHLDEITPVDDCALPFGAIRLKPSGSDAGHNGLKNIAQMLGTQAYARLRFGIGNDFPRGGQIDYVLGHFTDAEIAAMSERIPVAVDAIKTFCLCGMQKAMCDFNNK